MKIYSCEVGVLLPDGHPEFLQYATCYDKKHSFYDENRWDSLNLKAAKDMGKMYVKEGVDLTYCVVSCCDYNCDEDRVRREIGNDGYTEIVNNWNGDHLSLDAVVYCCYKSNGEIIEDFMIKENDNADSCK